MAIVPLKQEITLERGEEIDEWGKTVPGETITHKCRVDEGTFLVEYKSSSNISSKEVVAKARILLDKIQDVRYDDIVVYINELDQEIRKKPKKIDVRRDLSAKPILTEVYV